MAARFTSVSFGVPAWLRRTFLAIIAASACGVSVGRAADYTVGIERDGPSWYFDRLIE
jgi:hypothetical protein